MFWGESVHQMDVKGRVFAPVRFQDQLDRDPQGELVAILTRGFENCVFLFSRTGFQRALARMRTQPFGGAKLRQMQRQFFGNAYEVTLDAQGRLLVPEKLKTRANLVKEVVMVGVSDRAEIWDRATWERYVAETDAEYDRLDGVLIEGEAAPPDGEG